MAATIRMPIRGSDKAPKFDGTAENLLAFIEDYEACADDANLVGGDRIKGIIRYLPNSERALWSGMPEAKLSDYNAFIKEVKEMYPGCEGEKRYAVSDLQSVTRKHAALPMPSLTELGNYRRAFREIADSLIAKDHIGTAERNRMWLEGFPSDIQALLRTRLMIKFPDHHPRDPYPFADVDAAAKFLIPGMGTVSPETVGTSVLTPYPSATAPAAKAPQQPAQGTVVKQEYQARRPGSGSPSSGCMFCGKNDHFLSRCQEKDTYISAGKCKVHETSMKLVLTSGDWIPGRASDGTLKDRLDRYHSNKQANEALPSSSVTAALYVRAATDVDVVLDIDPSAFIHTVAESESDIDEEDVDVLRAAQALALATARRDTKRGSAKGEGKGKTVRFDGVEIASEYRAKPAPASRQATVAEEIVSPAVQASSSKGKAPEVAKAITAPAAAESSANARRTNAAPATSSSSSPVITHTDLTDSTTNTASSSAKTASYRYSHGLEDKDADKRILERLLDTHINISTRELFAISPDLRKQFRDLTTTKRVTVGTVSVNELTGHPVSDEWMRDYDAKRLRSDDGRVVADHFAPLRCIRATTIGGRVVTCVLDQGAEVVVMPAAIWKTLGVGLRSDHRLNMESVNTNKDATLGVIENVPLDFGGGPLYFQVQVIPRASFEILLGRPFFKLTTCRTFDLPDGEQDILVTDPNTRKELRIPMLPWVKRCERCTSGHSCSDHPPKVKEEKGF
jgi:hypothetical protein